MDQSRKKHFTFRMTNDVQPIMISNNNPQKKGRTHPIPQKSPRVMGMPHGGKKHTEKTP